MRISDLIWALSEVDEDLVLAAKEDIIMTKKHGKALRIGLIAAAIIVLLTGTVIGIYYTRVSAELEDNWNSRTDTAMTGEQKDYVEALSADIGESVTDQGITVTVDSVTCTGDTAYVLLHYELDTELYDMDALQTCTPLNMTTVTNDGFGTLNMSMGSYDGEKRADGIWSTYTVEFSDQPEGAVLNDGNSVMSIEISTIELWYDGYEQRTEIEGSWNFAFTLPEGEAYEPVKAAQEMTFDSGVTLLVTDVEVTESGCHFTVATEMDEYYFVDGATAELARAAQSELVQFTVDAALEDGTLVPCSGARMIMNEETLKDEWTISWASPLDPATVKSLVFSDGETEFTIELK